MTVSLGKNKKDHIYKMITKLPHTMKHYLKRTRLLRTSNQLFISSQSPHNGVTKDTLARRIKLTLTKSGIDTSTCIFKAHSTRAAAASAAARTSDVSLLSEVLRLPYGVSSLPLEIPIPSQTPPPVEKPQGPPPSYLFTPDVHVTERFRNFLWLNSLSSFRSLFSCWETSTRIPLRRGTPAGMGGGRMFEELIAENDLIILDSGEQTFHHSAYHSTSAIDLAVASPPIAVECSWVAHSDLCAYIHSFNFQKANLNHLGDLCRLSLNDSVADIEQFTSKLLDPARSSIRFHKGMKFKTGVPWFTQECRQALQESKKAQRKYFKTPSVKNLIN
ncbi:RNA-directed DNA polymerase from mobile element jockey [Plakobranchus ocellatus]|uniref:RNA-directed DNA polymerase from mobile element jockey n=1 Tax=Plakobranchus ocellatus TaxID=259542 RepID=A0AAV4BWA0_9GAST|nr:RNA-directed DNA polymerase from mobile element jockey [Plakobranchus ocellatus]